MCQRLVGAQAGEGRLVAGVDRLAVLATAAGGTTTEVTAGSTTTGSTAATATASIATGTATAAAAAPSALGLDVAVLDLDEGLGLALALALSLAAGSGEELLLLILGEGSKVLPLVVLDALVGLAELDGSLGLESQLLLGLLGEVLVVRDVLILGLLLLSLALGSLALLALGLGDLGACLLILQLSLALVGAPGSGGLLLGVAAAEVVSDGRRTAAEVGGCLLGSRLGGVAVTLLAPATAACEVLLAQVLSPQRLPPGKVATYHRGSRHGGHHAEPRQWAYHGSSRARHCGRGRLCQQSARSLPHQTTTHNGTTHQPHYR